MFNKDSWKSDEYLAFAHQTFFQHPGNCTQFSSMQLLFLFYLISEIVVCMQLLCNLKLAKLGNQRYLTVGSSAVALDHKNFRRRQLMHPSIHNLMKPISRGKALSSWFHEKDPQTGFPTYLFVYSKYFRVIIALHSLHLHSLGKAFKSTNPQALSVWVAECSRSAPDLILPESAARILQIFFLDLFVFAKNISHEMASMLPGVIEHAFEDFYIAHRLEMYRDYLTRYNATKSARRRYGILQRTGPQFLKDLLEIGLLDCLDTIRATVSFMYKETNLRHFLTLWAISKTCASVNPTVPVESRLEVASAHFRTHLKQAFPKIEQERDYYLRAYIILIVHLEDTEEISLFIADHDRTVGDEVKTRLAVAHPSITLVNE